MNNQKEDNGYYYENQPRRISNFSDYIIFCDESGDQGLNNKGNKIFLLNFCIFNKDDYLEFSKNLKALKLKYFNDDVFVFHDSELTKRRYHKEKLKRNKNTEEALLSLEDEDVPCLLEDIEKLIDATPFKILAVVVDKRTNENLSHIDAILKQSKRSLYQECLKKGLEALHRFLCECNMETSSTHLVMEEIGNNESEKWRSLAYEVSTNSSNELSLPFPIHLKIIKKELNNEGLQLADLTAKNVGQLFLDPNGANRTFEILNRKLLKDSNGKSIGLLEF